MRLLIITQKVDSTDDVFSFFHRWLVEFAKNCDQLTVIALGVGKYELPKNVHVLSLGKELGVSRFRYLLNFYKYIWQERKNYDAVFVHMNPVYVNLGGILWRMWGKSVALWYTHKNVDLKLRTAEKIANVIFSASLESFRLKSKKLVVAGHGIDVDIFKPVDKKVDGILKIITAGRISPVKNFEVLIEAATILLQKNISIDITIVGDIAQESDRVYLAKLKALISEGGLNSHIHFVGKLPNRDLPGYLAQGDVFVNMSETGSLDKGVLEAMAMELPTVTSNEAFRPVFAQDQDTLMFSPRDAQMFVQKLLAVRSLDENSLHELTKRLRRVVVEKHNIGILIPRLLRNMLSSKSTTL